MEELIIEQLEVFDRNTIKLLRSRFQLGANRILNIKDVRIPLDGDYQVIGNSGSGKTTFLRSFSSLYSRNANRVLDGENQTLSYVWSSKDFFIHLLPSFFKSFLGHKFLEHNLSYKGTIHMPRNIYMYLKDEDGGIEVNRFEHKINSNEGKKQIMFIVTNNIIYDHQPMNTLFLFQGQIYFCGKTDEFWSMKHSDIVESYKEIYKKLFDTISLNKITREKRLQESLSALQKELGKNPFFLESTGEQDKK